MRKKYMRKLGPISFNQTKSTPGAGIPGINSINICLWGNAEFFMKRIIKEALFGLLIIIAVTVLEFIVTIPFGEPAEQIIGYA